MILNLLLNIIGFISVLALIAGPVLTIVFLILWLTSAPEKKTRYKKLALMFIGTFIIGIFLIFITLGSYAFFNYKKNSATESTVTEINTENSSKQELIGKPTPELSITEKLNVFANNLKVENPETFSYPGCIMYHGLDGDINKWATLDNMHLQKIYTYLNNANSKYNLVKLDYSKNPNNVSDTIYIVTCTCEQSKQVQTETNQLGLDFNEKLQHYPQLLCSE
jgi:hypothetical protein